MFFFNKTSKLTNICLIFFSSFLPIFICDLALKNLRLPKDSNRLMLLAGSSLYTSKGGYRRYEANKNIEQLAIYDDVIGYRYSYKSNNLGLVSYPNLDNNNKLDLVINGDSFTEGQGGYPWIMNWQKNELKKINKLSLNYAIAGNGFEDFLKASIHARKIYQAKKNIIFFIEHDAYRPYQKISKNKNCSFYSNGLLDRLLGPLTCKTYGIVWHHVKLNKTNAQILNQSKYLQQYGVIPSLYNLLKVLNNYYASEEISTEDKKNEINYSEFKLRFGPLRAKTKLAIREINKLYGRSNVLYVQLPNKEGKPDKRSIFFTNLIQEVDNNKVINLWESCPLNRSDFHKLDSHPNSEGYKKIKKCIVQNIEINNFIRD